MVKKIFKTSDVNELNILHTPAKDVPLDLLTSDEIQGVIDDMIDTLIDVGGLGLSANQIGSEWNIFVLSEANDKASVYVNPIIVVKSGQAYSYKEGCLSVLDRYDIKRASEVKIKAYDRNGRVIGLKTRTKMYAFAVQHEMDHLRGVLICDSRG